MYEKRQFVITHDEIIFFVKKTIEEYYKLKGIEEVRIDKIDIKGGEYYFGLKGDSPCKNTFYISANVALKE